MSSSIYASAPLKASKRNRVLNPAANGPSGSSPHSGGPAGQSSSPHHHHQGRADLTEDQRQEIKEAFDLFDTDKDGAVDYHELKVAMRALGFDFKKAEVLRILQEADRAGEGIMRFDAFEKTMTALLLARDPKEEIHRAFKLFDDDNTGKISIRNLRRVAKELGEGLDEDELQAMIEEFDLDQDGEISLQEFMAIMMDED
ncbi:ca2-binding ef-hand superfamily protein [Phaffia rhodozyma]|uniref:Ca2-binding ef-hand superfamily protein n=1 Tax=Phaffia rhodozyma TaxID=264483 RepID=A0A0F7SM50_PHARH|nr:ca2-binding ef-hand superfamily protein [Phaffia rhodozyma]